MTELDLSVTVKESEGVKEMRANDILEIGTKVAIGKRKGFVLSYGRSSRNPWNVYLIVPEDGKGNQVAMPNGEVFTAIEVHADRVEKL